VVSGCSFTYNNHETEAVTWPYYLADLMAFEQVWDCSLPGAGNHHIATSVIWNLSESDIDPRDALVVVMWSGNDRDDIIARETSLAPYSVKSWYCPGVVSGITGGRVMSRGNLSPPLSTVDVWKNPASRSVENYLYIDTCAAWLQKRGYRFLFVDYLDRSLPRRNSDFDIRGHLPDWARQQLDDLMAPVQDPYSFCLRRDLLHDDDYHPSVQGHLEWTREILVPYIQTHKFNT
jgi:hypothetical protein